MTAVFITLGVVVALVSMSIINAARDVALAKHKAAPQYPHQDGNYIVLGPEIFTDPRADVICWKGVNYIPQEPKEKSA